MEYELTQNLTNKLIQVQLLQNGRLFLVVLYYKESFIILVIPLVWVQQVAGQIVFIQ